MLSVAGVGALSSSVYMAARKSIKGLPLVTSLLGCVASLALIVFSQSRSLLLSMLMMLFLGVGMTIQMSATNTMIQSVVTDQMRGRVLSVYTMAFNSLTPFGALLMGFLVKQFKAPLALTLSASVCLIWSLNGIRVIPNLMKSILRMLVTNKNTQIYRPAPVSIEYAGVEG
jgi:MFS family permease